MLLTVERHPLLDLRVFTTAWPRPLSEMPGCVEVAALLSRNGPAQMQTCDAVRDAVRRLLRQAGFRPTGRSKPAAEYLLKAVQESKLTSINPAVDACNAVSLQSGLPISVVDLARVRQPLRVGVAPVGASYVFNSAGQSIDLGGLLCLFDADGPCANAVKDAQRTKTMPETQNTLSLIWGTTELPGRAAEAEAWYRRLLEQGGATTADADLGAG